MSVLITAINARSCLSLLSSEVFPLPKPNSKVNRPKLQNIVSPNHNVGTILLGIFPFILTNWRTELIFAWLFSAELATHVFLQEFPCVCKNIPTTFHCLINDCLLIICKVFHIDIGTNQLINLKSKRKNNIFPFAFLTQPYAKVGVQRDKLHACLWYSGWFQ